MIRELGRRIFQSECDSDHFRLDMHRLVLIDDHIMEITGLSGDAPWDSIDRLTVEFRKWHGPKEA